MDRNYGTRGWLFDDIVNFLLPLFRLSISSTFFRVALHLYDQTKVYDRQLYYVAKDPRDTIVSTANKQDNLSIVDRSKKKEKKKDRCSSVGSIIDRLLLCLDLFPLWLIIAEPIANFRKKNEKEIAWDIEMSEIKSLLKDDCEMWNCSVQFIILDYNWMLRAYWWSLEM